MSMGWSVIPIMLLVWNFMLYPFNGLEGYSILPEKEDLKSEDELKLLNKTTVKTIHTKYGDIYDCMDFYQQPTFNHPLLKNHNFHPKMRPKMLPRRLTPKRRAQNYKSSKLGLEDGGCPFGTVPIKRMTKDDLVRAKLYPEMFDAKSNIAERPGTHHAVARTTEAIAYHGAGGEFNVYNIPATAPQYTSGQVKMINGDESMIAGWTVNPGLYGDNQTRSFVYTNAGKVHCFNAQCGFVQLNRRYPLGIVMTPYSNYGGDQYGAEISIYQDIISSNWYLAMFGGPVIIGFWPHQIFINLGKTATGAEWGGEAFSPPGVPGPGMGSGHMPRLNPKYDGYSRRTSIGVGKYIIDPHKLQTFTDNDKYFRVFDLGNVGGLEQHLILYGGVPGVVV